MNESRKSSILQFDLSGNEKDFHLKAFYCWYWLMVPCFSKNPGQVIRKVFQWAVNFGVKWAVPSGRQCCGQLASWWHDTEETEDPPPPPEYTAAIVHCHHTNIALLSEIIQCPRLTDSRLSVTVMDFRKTPDRHHCCSFPLGVGEECWATGPGPAGVTMDTAQPPPSWSHHQHQHQPRHGLVRSTSQILSHGNFTN